MHEYRTYPIILAHGIARFDILSQRVLKVDNNDLFDGIHYFRNIRTHLQRHGFYVHHTNVDWAGGVDRRSGELKRQIDELLADKELGAKKVHIIAHSMGGLDARHMLFDHREDGFDEKVASLTTIATPHHGSPAADAIVADSGHILDIFKLGAGARDLTTQACRKFNEKAAAWESNCKVHFQAYAGAQEFWHIFGPLKLTWPLIYDKEGDNDGLVSVKSARWTDDYFREPLQDADHFNLCGWWDPAERVTPAKLESEIKGLYLGIAEGLAG